MHLHLLGVDIPDNPTKEEMVAYLNSHFAYDTMNSCNCSHSFAHCIKVHRLNTSREEADLMYDMLEIEEAFYESSDILREFDRDHHYDFQIGANGRSGGYLVLYRGGARPGDWKSYCPSCGQKNFKSITEGDSACGVCRETRVDFKTPPLQIYTTPGIGFYDQWMELEEEDKLEQVEFFFGVVADFDKACEEYCSCFLDFAKNHRAEEREIMCHAQLSWLFL